MYDNNFKIRQSKKKVMAFRGTCFGNTGLEEISNFHFIGCDTSKEHHDDIVSYQMMRGSIQQH